MKQSIRQELMQDLLMTNVYIDRDYKYIDSNQIAYTYNNRNIKQFQIIINGSKLDSYVYSLRCKEKLTEEQARDIMLEILVTHEIGHIHNLHIFEKYTEVLNKLKWCCLKNNMSLDNLYILGDSHAIINIAEDIQVNSDYLSQRLVNYANINNLGLWISGISPLPEFTDYKIKYKKTVEEYFQELINLVKSIKEKNKQASNQEIRENIENKILPMQTETAKDESFSKDDSLDIMRDVLNEKLKGGKDEEIKERQRQRKNNNFEKDANKLAKDKNNKNSSYFIPEDKEDKEEKEEETEINNYGNFSSNKNINIQGHSAEIYRDIKIVDYLKKILTHYTKTSYKRDVFRYERRGTAIPNILKTGYKKEFKKNSLKCLFIIDVSGSMSTESIRKAIINLKLELFKRFNKIDVLFYDTEEELKLNIKDLTDKTPIPCGGGTDMIEAILENQAEYNNIILYSDFATDLSNVAEITCSNLHSIVYSSSINKDTESFKDYARLNKSILYTTHAN